MTEIKNLDSLLNKLFCESFDNFASGILGILSGAQKIVDVCDEKIEAYKKIVQACEKKGEELRQQMDATEEELRTTENCLMNAEKRIRLDRNYDYYKCALESVLASALDNAIDARMEETAKNYLYEYIHVIASTTCWFNEEYVKQFLIKHGKILGLSKNEMIMLWVDETKKATAEYHNPRQRRIQLWAKHDEKPKFVRLTSSYSGSQIERMVEENAVLVNSGYQMEKNFEIWEVEGPVRVMIKDRFHNVRYVVRHPEGSRYEDEDLGQKEDGIIPPNPYTSKMEEINAFNDKQRLNELAWKVKELERREKCALRPLLKLRRQELSDKSDVPFLGSPLERYREHGLAAAVFPDIYVALEEKYRTGLLRNQQH